MADTLALTATSSVLKAIASHVGRALGRSDLAEVAIGMLQEDVIRLFTRIDAAIARMSEEVSTKLDPVEVLEVSTQN